MKPWIETDACKSRAHCGACLAGKWHGNEACPFGITEPPPPPQPPKMSPELEAALKAHAQGPLKLPSHSISVLATPPDVTYQKITSFFQAMLTALKVNDEIKAEREAICMACDKLKIDPKRNAPFCGMCGCGVSTKDEGWLVRNLAAYEENLPKWGCKHSLRNEGFGWKR